MLPVNVQGTKVTKGHEGEAHKTHPGEAKKFALGSDD